MKGWLAALRIARREARRAKGRSALVVALIGLPVLAATFAAVSYDMFTLTPEERLDRHLGSADAQLSWLIDAPIVQRDITGEWYEGGEEAAPAAHTAAEVAALLPAGSTVVERGRGAIRLPTATGTGELPWHALDLADPITDGLARITGGQAPAAAGEIAVTARAADRLGVTIGDRVAVPDAEEQLVVGIVEFPGDPGGWSGPEDVPDLRDQIVLFHPDGVPVDGWPPRWLVDTPAPIGWEQVRELNQHGIRVHSRAVALDPPAGVQDISAGPVLDVPQFSVGVLVAGLVALEVVLLAGPAFAVGARRRQRDLALVAAGGGTPAHLRRIVLADGVVLGGLATVVGCALGVGSAFAARPVIEAALVGSHAGDYRVFPLALTGIAAFAVVTAILAALVPAFTAARQRIVDALAGRRGTTRARRRWLVLGLAMVVLGTAGAGGGAWLTSTQAVLAGLIVGQLGLALCTPTLIGLIARIGPRLGLTARIALRDTARNRAAAAPAIAAVMAAVAGAVTVGVVWTSVDSQYDYPPRGYAPGTAAAGWDGLASDAAATLVGLEQIARATLPVAEVHHGWGFGDPGEMSLPQLLVPEENVCPFWERAYLLSPAEEQAAAQDARCPDSDYHPYTWVVIDDGTALAALVEADPDDLAAATQVLRSGGAVVTEERFLANGEAILGGLDDQGQPHYESATAVPGYLLTSRTAGQHAIISPAAARAVTGSDPVPSEVLITTERMPTQAEEDAFVAALEQVGSWGGVERGSHQEDRPLLVLLAIAAGLVALGAAGIATGLAAADRRGDLSTLGAVGASPRVRRLLSLGQSGVVAGLGSVLGLAAGFGSAAAVVVGLNQQYSQIWPKDPPIPITVPWQHLLGLLAVPVVAMLGAGLLTRSRLPVERRTG